MQESHGGNIYAHPECYDFSANLNPLGMPDAVRRAVIGQAELWAHYPDPACTALRETLARAEGIPPAQIVCGNGADDLIWRIVQALRPERALIAVPCFSEYRRALEAFGCTVETFPLVPENGFLLPDAFAEALHPALDLVILCTPNNPTGRCIPPELLREIARRCAENGTFLLSDECFLSLTAYGADYSAGTALHSRCIVLHAFTKTYAMPGLRLGYAVCGDPALAARIAETGQYWSVSAPAQTAGMAALEETGFLAQTRQMIAQERAFLMQEMQALGLQVFPSEANFLLFQARAGLYDDLLGERILLRSCANFEGLDGTYYRIAVRPHEENLALIEALRRWI